MLEWFLDPIARNPTGGPTYDLSIQLVQHGHLPRRRGRRRRAPGGAGREVQLPHVRHEWRGALRDARELVVARHVYPELLGT